MIWFIVDTFTCFVRAVAILDEKAQAIAEALTKQWISIFGLMETLLSDCGPNFVERFVSEFSLQLGVRRVTMMTFHSRTNGCV